jgi:adenylate cyclase
LGLVSWVANQKGLYQPWMAWPAATADCLFVLGAVWLSLVNIGVPGSHMFIFPSVWLAPLVLTFGALRFNPWLQGYITLVIVLGLFAMLLLTQPNAVAPKAQAISLFFADPPNYMRLAMLGLAGLVLVVASMRTRRVLQESLTEARHSANLTRYLPAQLAPRLAEGGLQELQRGTRQQMGVLFIDMRGFTKWSQHRAPQEIIDFMTEFRRRISTVARDTGGMIDKFMGDAAMIVFEGQSDEAAAARACVDCAERLDREITGWSRARVAAGKEAVRAGIGLHWGEVFSGVVGDHDRLEYSVFGDTVNTAARLEEMTKVQGVDIVASRDILLQAGFGPVPEGWSALAEVSVRGRTGTVEILGRTIGQ